MKKQITESREEYILRLRKEFLDGTRTVWNKGLKGIKSPFEGRKHSEESKKKTSETLKRIGHKPINNGHPWNEGKKWSEEIKDKISKSHKGKKLSEYAKKIAVETLKKNRKNVKSPKGENHPNWKGGITSLRNKIWHLREDKEWRKKILERDKYKCVLCDKVGGKLNVDHIIPFCYLIEKNKIKNTYDAIKCEDLWDIKNGRTLCIECHKKTDTYMNKAKKYGK